jgi:RluA family pseudouridine synthase
MVFSAIVSAPRSRGTLLVEYLSGRFTYHDPDHWRSLIAEGKVKLNGSSVPGDALVFGGDTLSYDAGEIEEPPADLSYRIAFEDEWFLCIDKPGNLLVHRAGISFCNNLTHQLRHIHTPAFPTAHPVHRLDRETSGALMVAKNIEARGALGREFDAGRVEKSYNAVVHGNTPTGEVDLPIGKVADSVIPYKFGVNENGKACRTHIIACETLSGEYSLLTLQPLTGRTHQIRVHCAALGNPIVGDKLYGQSEAAYLAWRDDKTRPSDPRWFPRQALHCASLSFVHPYTRKRCTIAVPLREDMRELVENIRAGTGHPL